MLDPLQFSLEEPGQVSHIGFGDDVVGTMNMEDMDRCEENEAIPFCVASSSIFCVRSGPKWLQVDFELEFGD
jgi:hypothetical protein